MRWIDADKLKHVIHCAYSDDLEILEKIDEQPTAFDVDKVVEQLEDIKRKKYRACQDVICEDCKYSEDCCEVNESDKLALDMAVEIVKGDGVR